MQVYECFEDHYHYIGEYGKALKIAKEIGDKNGEGAAYGNLGACYIDLGQYDKAIKYQEMRLNIAKESGDKNSGGAAYCNLGACYRFLGQCDKAIRYQEVHLTIAKEIGDKHGEGVAYGNLGACYADLDQYDKAIKYHEMRLTIAKEIGDKVGEGAAYGSLGRCYGNLGQYQNAESNLRKSVACCDELFKNLPKKDEAKVSFVNKVRHMVDYLVRILLIQEKRDEALIVAERGRSRTLVHLMFSTGASRYALENEANVSDLCEIRKLVKGLGVTVLFVTLLPPYIGAWVLQPNGDIMFEKRRTEVSQQFLSNYMKLHLFDHEAYINNMGQPNESMLSYVQKDLYENLLGPVRQYVVGSQAIVVPHGPLALVPFAALMDENGHYVAETLQLRLVPSLTTAKMIRERAEDPAEEWRPLVIGDPDVGKVIKAGKIVPVPRLPCAMKEVEIVGETLMVKPLVGETATKKRFLEAVQSANMIHIASHGDAKRGEILFARPPGTDTNKLGDVMLKITDLEGKRIKAKLVVLSSCNSGVGDVRGEGVVGIARAFLGAGARAALVTLWAVDDRATLLFMAHFYDQLWRRGSANESLNEAMNAVREHVDPALQQPNTTTEAVKEDKMFSHPRYWAPFVLLGEDVTPFAKP